MSNFPRARIGAALVVAFVCGLVFASGFDLTRFGWAQGRVTSTANGGVTSQNMPPLGDIQDGFEGAVDRVKPAVVTIEVTKYAQERGGGRRNGGGRNNNPCADMQSVPPDMQGLLKQFCQGGGGQMEQGPQEPMQGSGSGFIVTKDGYILTNNHVVADVDRVTVKLVDHRQFEAKVVGRDSTTDVAVIKIDATDLPTVVMGDDANAHVGQWALAIGNPLDLDFTVTAGIVSAKGRSLPGIGGYSITDFIQTDAAINPGNSGGPLVNVRGEVIGINSAIESETGSYVGYGFAIPITLAEQVMNDLIKYGTVRRAILGVQLPQGEVTPEDAQAAGLKTIGGAKVEGFSPDADNPNTSPAGRAGIKPGDIIISAAGKPVDKNSTLQRIIRGFQPGQTVDIEVMRFGQEKTFKVTLAAAPQAAAPSDSSRAPAVPTRASRTPAPEAKSIDRLGISVAAAAADSLLFADNPPPAPYLSGLVITKVDQRGSNFEKVFSPWIITKELAPTERDIKSQADLDKALADVKPGGVITLIMATPQQAGGWSTSPLSLRVK